MCQLPNAHILCEMTSNGGVTTLEVEYLQTAEYSAVEWKASRSSTVADSNQSVWLLDCFDYLLYIVHVTTFYTLLHCTRYYYAGFVLVRRWQMLSHTGCHVNSEAMEMVWVGTFLTGPRTTVRCVIRVDCPLSPLATNYT